MDDQLLTEARVRALVPDRIFRRGESYCARGQVLSIVRRGDVVHAFVQGREDEPYTVELTTRGDRILARCSCPYAQESDSWCKHVVAVMIGVIRHDGPIMEQPTLDSLLGPLDRQALESVVERLVEQDARLYGLVRLMAERPGLDWFPREWLAGGERDGR